MEFNLFKTEHTDYYVCNNGTIYSKYNFKHPLKSFIIDGYNKIRFTKGSGENRVNKYYRIDYLVASTYLDNPHNFMFIKHKDGNLLNDNVTNLEWQQFCIDIPSKIIDGYNNKYIITNTGKVFNNFTGKEMKQKIVAGYKAVALRKFDNNKSIQTIYKIHKLVATYFIPNPKNFPIINHKDGNKLNNEISNLEWCTYKENIIHAIKTQLIKTEINLANGQCVIDLIEKYGYNYSDVGKLLNIKRQSVATFYQHGYKSFGFITNNIHVKKHSEKKELPKEFVNKYNIIYS